MKIFFSKKLFTLLEILIASTIISIILIVVVSIYSNMMKVKFDVEARQSLMQWSYLMLEKLNILMKDYKIDYEEYFNRSYAGCNSSTWVNFVWDSWAKWYCGNFTAYWNSNDEDSSNEHLIYYCSSSASTGSILNVDTRKPWIVYQNNNLVSGSWCFEQSKLVRNWYWTYKYQFWDMGDDIDWDWAIKWDEDDVNLWLGPDSIRDNENVQELYLIDKYEKKRIYMRRALLWTWDYNKDWNSDKDFEKYYSLQILKLRSFDLWADHDSLWISSWQYDWQIDTWACDYSEWFSCNWKTLWWAYANYNLPQNEDDWWVNLFWKELTLVDWNMKLYPVKDASLAFRENNYQLNPYIKIYFKTKLYWESWAWKVNPNILDEFEMNLQTTFNVKTFY